MSLSPFNQVGEVKGKSSENEESFTFQFTPQNENLRSTRGSLFTLVTVEGKTSERMEKAKSYYHAFQSSYYAKASGSIINGLSETLDQLEKDFAKKEEPLKYSLVAAVLWGAVLYLAKSGSNVVWVSRGEKLKKLDFNKVASGVLEDQDTICLASSHFNEKVTQEDLSNYLAAEKFQDVLAKLDGNLTNLEGAACLVVRLSVHDSAQEEVKPLAMAQVGEDGEIEEPSENTVAEVKSEEDEPVAEEAVPVTAVPSPSVPPVSSSPNALQSNLSQAKTKLKPFLSNVQLWGKKFAGKLAAPWKKPKAGELVDHVAIRRQRLGQVVIFIVLILVLSLGRSFWMNGKNEEKEKVTSLISSAQTQLNEAKNIKTIDPVRANNLVTESQVTLTEAKKLDEGNQQIRELEHQASQLIAEITRSYTVSSLGSVYDFSKLNSSASLNQMSIINNLLLATDTKTSSVYTLDLNSKEASKVDSTFSSPAVVAGYTDGFYIQSGTSILRYLASSGAVSTVSESNDEWGEVVAAATFQANLYMLDAQEEQIWRYLSTGSNLASARSYIVGDKPDLSQAVGIAIDDYVWVATKKGDIYKFAQGKVQTFTVSNLLSGFGQVVGIFTDNVTKNLYLLDKGKGSIVVLDKNGVYQAQYTHTDLKKATSLVVNEEEKTAYVAIEGKLVSLSLR